MHNARGSVNKRMVDSMFVLQVRCRKMTYRSIFKPVQEHRHGSFAPAEIFFDAVFRKVTKQAGKQGL